MGAPVIVAAPPTGALAALLAAAAALLWLGSIFARMLRSLMAYWKLDLPSPPVNSALLGHASAMLSDTQPLKMESWSVRCGPIFKLRLVSMPLVILTDPAEIIKMNRLPGVTKPDMYREFDLPSSPSPSLFSDEGSPYWKAVRSGVAPCFSMTSLKRTFPWVLHLCKLGVAEVQGYADKGQPVDVAELAARVTSDTIGDMLISKDFGGMARAASKLTDADSGSADYIALVRDFLAALHWRLNDPLHRWRFGSVARKHRVALATWDATIEAFSRDVMASAPPEYTIAGHLLKVIDPTTGKPLSLNKLKNELSIFYIAGFDTTSHAITWSLGLLASHPEVQSRLLQELEVVGLAPSPQHPTPRDFEWGDLGRLPFLAAVIKEALRLFQPAAGGSLRMLPTQAEILGHTLPKGTLVAQPFHALGRSRINYGDDADQFKPERWLKEGPTAAGEAEGADKEAAGPPDAMTFSVGSRDCVGRALAMLELQVVLATLVGHFRFDLTPEDAAKGGLGSIQPLQAKVCYHITLFPRNGLKLMATPRAASS